MNLDWLTNLFSRKHHIHWVEILVILAIVLFLFYIAHSLNLFKKE